MYFSCYFPNIFFLDISYGYIFFHLIFMIVYLIQMHMQMPVNKQLYVIKYFYPPIGVTGKFAIFTCCF